MEKKETEDLRWILNARLRPAIDSLRKAEEELINLIGEDDGSMEREATGVETEEREDT